MKRNLAMAALGLMAALAPEDRAKACSRLPCELPVRGFWPDNRAPANRIHFKLTGTFAGPIELRTADGTLVPGSIRQIGPDRVFAPDQAPASGQKLTVHYWDGCLPTPGPPPLNQRYQFDVGPPVQQATAAGRLVFDRREFINSTPGKRAMTVHFRYEPDVPELVPVTERALTIGGHSMWATDTSIGVGCDPGSGFGISSCGNTIWTTAGIQRLEMRTRLIGDPVEQVATLDLDTRCPAPEASPGPGSTPPVAAPDPQPTMGGCSMGRGPRAGLLPLLIVVAVIRLSRSRRS